MLYYYIVVYYIILYYIPLYTSGPAERAAAPAECDAGLREGRWRVYYSLN